MSSTDKKNMDFSQVNTKAADTKANASSWRRSFLKLEQGDGEEFYHDLLRLTRVALRGFYAQLSERLGNDFIKDIAHDVFIKLAESATFRLLIDAGGDEQALNQEASRFIWRAVKNRALDTVRTKNYEEKVENLEYNPDFTTRAEQEETTIHKEFINRLFGQLSDKRKFIFLNYEKFQGTMNRSELASALKISVAAVQKNADKIRVIAVNLRESADGKTKI